MARPVRRTLGRLGLNETTTETPVKSPPAAEAAVPRRPALTRIADRLAGPEGIVFLTVAAWSLILDLVALAGARLIAPGPHPGRAALTAAWQQWDANWYLRIVGIGYHAMIVPIPGHDSEYLQAAFYPGFPLIARGVYDVLHPLGVGITGAMLLTNQVLVFAMALLLYRLAVALTHRTDVGVRTVQYLLLFPFAYFLLAPYSETLFLTCLAGFSWAQVTRRYAVAAVFGAVASATRPLGLVLPLILLVAYLEQHQWRLRSIKPRTIVWVLVPLTGAAAFAVYQWAVFNNPFYAEHVEQVGWARSLTLNLWRIVRQSFEHQPLSAGYLHGVPVEAFVIWPLAIGFVALSVVVWRRFGAAMGLLCLLLLVEPVVSGTMMSFNRYVLPLLPCFVVLAVWGRNTLLDFAYRTAGTMLLALFLILFVHGIWTG